MLFQALFLNHPFKMKLATALAANAANNIAKPAVLLSPIAAIMKASTTDIVPVALASFSRRFMMPFPVHSLRLSIQITPHEQTARTLSIDQYRRQD